MDIQSLNLKKFEDVNSRISRKISLTKSYSFGIPPTFFAENGLSGATHAILFFDENQKVVGISFKKNGSDKEGFKLVVYGEGEKQGASFVARSFFNKYKIDPKKCWGKYEPEVLQLEEVKLFIFQLKERT